VVDQSNQRQQADPDALWGVDAWVVELFGELPEEEHTRRVRQVTHQLSRGQLPGVKIGRFWAGSKTRLRQFLAATTPV
jgi:hypothetical protein